ncbi:MAG: hypothetical protein KTR25_14875 [Myxococcales bacterium]|nr:hypothetical protein [Myxococcales bacterium]
MGWIELLLILGETMSAQALSQARLHPQLTAVPLGAVAPGDVTCPRWSKDGRHIAFERVFHAQKRVELYLLENVHSGHSSTVRLSGQQSAGSKEGRRSEDGKGRLRSLFKGLEIERCHDLAWATEDVAFVCNDGGEQLYIRRGKRRSVAVTEKGVSAQPTWSADGMTLVFVSTRDGLGALHQISFEGDRLDGPSPLLKRSENLELYPQWHPKKPYLLYTAMTSGRGSDVHLLSEIAAQAKIRQLVSTPYDEFHATWSPNGQKIAFYRVRNRGEGGPRQTLPRALTADESDIWIKDVSADQPSFRLASAVHVTTGGPAWSPDGDWVVYTSGASDQLFAAEAKIDGQVIEIPLATISNREPVLTKYQERWFVAYTTLGEAKNDKRMWRRLYWTHLDSTIFRVAGDKEDKRNGNAY